MRAPEFWNHASGREAAPVTRTLLSPLSLIYRLGAGWRALTSGRYRAPVPVVCVGNITVGGAGKTPVSIALMERLRRQGVEAHALTRGYMGRLRGPVMVDAERHTYRDVGDEALLLAKSGPTWVAKSKRAGAKAAAKAGAQVIVMDDGFQNPTIIKDVALLLIDAEWGLGNGKVLPAGPLRETPRSALRRADAVVTVSSGGEEDRAAPWRTHLRQSTPLLAARVQPKAPIPPGPVYAFAGIQRPEKFFNALVNAGAEVKATQSFPDHHPFSRRDLTDLRDAARRHNALLLTTEKDHVRLPPELRRMVHAWPVAARFQDEAKLDAILERALDRAAAVR